jgi:hypothetical protein
MSTNDSPEPLLPFPELIRKHHWPKRSAYGWKDAGLFPVIQINRIILVRESEVLNALALFRRVGRTAPPKLETHEKRRQPPRRYPKTSLPQETAK